ncbi:LacI family DNA-binding transcriptional regulator [Phycicoccus sp. CMS6Z-2]|nr:LacI family DNA-binding transcriptional regulator [Phycicoccus flavus]
MADVARLAGVSHQTVSRVVNDAAHISPETREKVLDAIERLGYRPNTSARALVRGRTGIIGVIATASVEFGPVSIQRTVEQAAAAAGFFPTSVNLPELSTAALEQAVDHLRTLGVEAVVMIAGHDEALGIVRAQRTGVPVVVAQGDLGRDSSGVGVDQWAAARAVTEHLVGLGHREIVHVSGPLDWAEARARLEGWRQAMFDAGLRPASPITGDWSSESGFRAGLQICQRPEVTAVFAANDQIALGLLRALYECGRTVPGDVSVVGVDDIPEAAYLIPPLTTVRQDFAAVGRRAIDLVQRLVAGEPAEPVPLLVPELVVRSSTAPPPPLR